MKKLLFVLGVYLLQFCVSPSYIPTPKKSMSVVMMQDSSYKWKIRNIQSSSTLFIAEGTREHENLGNWTECYIQQVLFADISLPKFIDTWTGMMKSKDAKATFEQKILSPNKVLVKYNFGGEFGIYVNSKEEDGIYQNGWMSKVSSLDSARANYFEKMLVEAELYDNSMAN